MNTLEKMLHFGRSALLAGAGILALAGMEGRAKADVYVGQKFGNYEIERVIDWTSVVGEQSANIADVDFDGGKLKVLQEDKTNVFEYDLASGTYQKHQIGGAGSTLQDDRPTIDQPQGIAGEYILIQNRNLLIETGDYPPQNIRRVSQVLQSGEPRDLASDGRFLYYSTSGSDGGRIYTVDPELPWSQNIIVKSFPLPYDSTLNPALALTHDGSHLVLADRDTGQFMELDSANGSVLSSYTLPGFNGDINGLGYDVGQNRMFIGWYNGDSGHFEIGVAQKVPELSTLGMLGAGAAVLAGRKRFVRK